MRPRRQKFSIEPNIELKGEFRKHLIINEERHKEALAAVHGGKGNDSTDALGVGRCLVLIHIT